MGKNKSTPSQEETQGIKPAEAENTAITPDEQGILSRATASKPDWDLITEKSMHDFSLSEFAYDLPKEAKEKQNNKEFAYKWVKRDPSRIDSCLHAPPPRTLWICNLVNSPYLEKYIDSSVRCVVRDDLVLMKRPWKMHRIYQDAKMNLFKNKERSGLLENQDGKRTDKAKYMVGEEHKIGGRDEVFVPPSQNEDGIGEFV